MFEYKEKLGKAVKCYRENEDGTITKVVVSAVRRKNNAIVIMATEQENDKKPKIDITNIAIKRNEPLIFNDLTRADEWEGTSQKIETELNENSQSTMTNSNK